MRRAIIAVLATLALGNAAAEAGPPEAPRVVQVPEVGTPGGELRTLIGRARDTRLLNVYGSARLISYDQSLELIPDILESYDVEEGRIFTFHLRKGHRWSDGEPFTAEDFRFYWEDVAQNSELQPTGPEIQLLVDGELPKFEVVDDTTVRYTWSKPNPFFIPAIAAASQLFIYRPAHYLKQFHKKYIDADQLSKLVADTKSRDWVQLFLRKDRLDNVDNPDMPTLQPWMLTTPAPAQRFVAKRNPNFHRVDQNGQQLPYFDSVVLDVVDSKLVPIKTGAGETDLQARHLFFKDYTFLKESEKRSGLRTLLWPEARAAHLAIYPNLNANDQVWHDLFRDIRFRKALALGIDRDALSQFLYFGLAKPANNTIISQSPLFKEEYAEQCIGFDQDEANKLLDELGLDKRGKDNVRLLPDGRPMELVVETAGEDSEQSDILELVRDQWEDIGFRIHTKPSEREVLRNRIFAGDALMSIWYGIDNGAPTASLPPKDYAPTSQADQPQWPKWGQYYETKGKAGEAPDLPEGQQLMDLYGKWQTALTEEEQTAAWEQILQIFSSQCFTIGLVGEVMQPVAVRNNLRNIPDEGIFNWEPHGQFGIYMPDTFFYAK
ncbi:MAG: ABC transporter substrate-binding protein [Geminicoccaceae bacterium]